MEMISFRSDDKLKKELDYIKSSLNSTQTEAIKDAIHAFYKHLRYEKKAKKSPQELLKDSGYLASFEGEEDLSINYKKDLTRGWKKKHGEE